MLLIVCPAVIAGEDEDDEDRPEAAVVMKPTEIGVRFTPKMARVISKKIVGEMKGQYDLDNDQVDAIQQILRMQFVEFARENAETGRDMIEAMLETVIENDGGFPKESAMEFAKLAKPLIPALKTFCTDTAGKIGKEMTIKQRLKLTADMVKATAGLAIFENRMKRWEEGKVGEHANPFWDRGDDDSSKDEPEPEDPNEHPEHRKARKSVERWIQWQIDVDKNWESYLNQAIEYYGFTEPQQTAAKAILKDCTERMKRSKTPELRAALIENRIARRLCRRLDPKVNQGPWMFRLEAEYEKLRKPLLDLDREFKRRIDGLPTSEQRAEAKEEVRKALAEKGLKKLPA
jgi:hypothetical protein